jgi:hypothetical protein
MPSTVIMSHKAEIGDFVGHTDNRIQPNMDLIFLHDLKYVPTNFT